MILFVIEVNIVKRILFAIAVDITLITLIRGIRGIVMIKMAGL
jgi:hypothetical protein